MTEISLLVVIGWVLTVVLLLLLRKTSVQIVHHISAGGEVIERLDLITSKLDNIMNAQERLAKAIADLNEGTNDIAADLQALKDQITAGTVTPEALDQLDQNIAVLKQLGQQQ